MNLYYFITILIFLLPLTLCLKRKSVANFFALYDFPDSKKKTHKGKVPLIGGLIFLSYFNLFFIINFFFFSIIPKYVCLIFLIYTNVFYIIGFLDDKFKIHPLKRIITTIILLLFIHLLFKEFYLSEIYIGSFDKLVKLNFIITLLCFLLLQIAVNLSDGTNGTVGLYSIYWSMILIYLSKYFFINIILFTFIITLIIFLFFNLQTKIFLGTSGCNYIAIFFSVISVFLNNNQLIPSEYFVSLFFIPGIDMIRIFILRFANNKNILLYDRSHLHHLLLEKFGKYNSLFYLFICVFFFYVSKFFDENYFLFFIIIFSAIYIIGLNKLCTKKKL